MRTCIIDPLAGAGTLGFRAIKSKRALPWFPRTTPVFDAQRLLGTEVLPAKELLGTAEDYSQMQTQTDRLGKAAAFAAAVADFHAAAVRALRQIAAKEIPRVKSVGRHFSPPGELIVSGCTGRSIDLVQNNR
ncbi:MAG: hypothetical protein Q7U34_13800 [Anaerolineales bacterium]|nr:hypothetical protein [Anaerolineales bacterium]